MFQRLPAVVALLALTSATAFAQQSITIPFSGGNQRASVTQSIGLVTVSVSYSSPKVHGPNGDDRKGRIWGGLVPYGLHDLGFNNCTKCPWRGGANENTVVTFSHDVALEGQKLAAGAYGLFFIADPSEWTVIFSRNSTSWGAFTYDPAEDALRVKVKPAPDDYREWLTYEFTERLPDKATLEMRWENLRVPIRIEVPNIEDLYVAQIRRELRNNDGYTWTNWDAAAQYCLTTKNHLADGLYFAKQAVGFPGIGVENFTTLTTLAQLQIANGQRDSAALTIEKALRPADANVLFVHQFGRQLQAQGEQALALKVFEGNAKRHPKTWPVNLGLARGHAGMKDFTKAAQFAQMALPQAPDSLNRANIRNLIEQWKKAAATTKP